MSGGAESATANSHAGREQDVCGSPACVWLKQTPAEQYAPTVSSLASNLDTISRQCSAERCTILPLPLFINNASFILK